MMVKKKEYKRIPWGEEKYSGFPSAFRNEPCPECDVEWGKLHEEGCDVEECPICGEQLLTCGHARILSRKRLRVKRSGKNSRRVDEKSSVTLTQVRSKR